MPTRAVLWDLGNVLLDWQPARLYRKLFATEAEVEHFLSEVCTMDWHQRHDAGTPMSVNREPLIEKHPHLEDAIRAWETGFEAMLDGAIPGTPEAMDALAARGVPQFALSNLPSEWVEPVHALYPQMAHMKDVVVSAHEGVVKPDRKIYEITARRIGFDPAETVFFDDRMENVEAARAYGFDAEHFQGAEKLQSDLAARGLL